MSNHSLRDLTQHFRQQGRVEAIYLRPARLVPVASVLQAEAEPGRGLIGDRRSLSALTGEAAQKREVTLFQMEHLSAIGAWMGLAELDASRLRRNLLVSGINLLSMRSLWKDVTLEWCIGDEAVFQITGSCDPCSRMETELGFAGYNAMRGHGGVTARVVARGSIRVGDAVRLKVTPLT
jgi:MOSC domain-containing protein YiiM